MTDIITISLNTLAFGQPLRTCPEPAVDVAADVSQYPRIRAASSDSQSIPAVLEGSWSQYPRIRAASSDRWTGSTDLSLT